MQTQERLIEAFKKEEESDDPAAAYEKALVSGVTGCYLGPDKQGGNSIDSGRFWVRFLGHFSGQF